MSKRSSAALRRGRSTALIAAFLLGVSIPSGLAAVGPDKFTQLQARFGNSYHAVEFNFKFMYLSNELIDYMAEKGIAFPMQEDVLQKAAKIDDDRRPYVLRATVLEITGFDPTRFVLVQQGTQFHVEKQDFVPLQALAGDKLYPGVEIEGILWLPRELDPTVPATIWYKEEGLGYFVITAEYRELLSVFRKPAKIAYLGLAEKTNGVHTIELVLEDEYGLSTKWQGALEYRLARVEEGLWEPAEEQHEKELLLEAHREIRKEEFHLTVIPGMKESKENEVFVYQWRERLEALLFPESEKKPVESNPTGGTTIGSLVAGVMPIGRLVVSLTLPTGERIDAVLGLNRAAIKGDR